MERNQPCNFHTNWKASVSFSSWDGETSPGNQECNHAGQEKKAQSWAFILLVLAALKLFLQIANSE